MPNMLNMMNMQIKWFIKINAEFAFFTWSCCYSRYVLSYHYRPIISYFVADMEFVNCFTLAKFQTFSREKRIHRDFFGKKLQTVDVLLINFEQIVSFCAIMCSNPNSLFYENSSLSFANFIELVIFCVNSWQFYTSPKMFYTSGSCAAHSMSVL